MIVGKVGHCMEPVVAELPQPDPKGLRASQGACDQIQ
jgi:hypothetical protein